MAPKRKKFWANPPKLDRPVITTAEKLPGKIWAEKGASWLAGEAATNISLEKRRKLAKICFTKAIAKCKSSATKAETAKNHDKSHRLKEITIWLIKWKDSI